MKSVALFVVNILVRSINSRCRRPGSCSSGRSSRSDSIRLFAVVVAVVVVVIVV